MIVFLYISNDYICTKIKIYSLQLIKINLHIRKIMNKNCIPKTM